MMKGATTGPVIDSSAPPWAQHYSTDLNAVIVRLIQQIAALEARVKALEG